MVGWCELDFVELEWSIKHISHPSAFSVVHGTVVLDGRRSATECTTVGCCGTSDEWMDGGERRRGVA